MKVYSPSAAPGSPITVRHRGLQWDGVRDPNGDVAPDTHLVTLLHAAGWSVARLRGEIDLTSLGADQPFDLRYRVRAMTEPAAGENRADALHEFIKAFQSSPRMVVEWSDSYVACVLDIDQHTKGVPPLPLSLAAQLTPKPYAVKQSRNGGIHCLYIGCGVHAALGLASLAAFDVERIYPSVTGIEVLTRCRCSETGWLLQTNPRFRPFSANVYTVDADEVQEWLSDRGLHPGGRYGHSLCPFSPDANDVDANPSVSVTSDGIKCFRCNRFASWSMLLYEDSGDLPPIWRMAKSRIWWDQVAGWADFHYPRVAHMMRDAYRGALILFHGADRHAMTALIQQGIVRTDTGWKLCSEDQLAAVDLRGLRRALDRLPSVIRLPRAGEDTAARKDLVVSNLDNIYSSNDLPLPDVPLLHTGNPSFCAMPDELYSDPWIWYKSPPRWELTEGPPTPDQLKWAWEEVERCFPQVDRAYLSLLIVAHLICRHDVPAQPIILAVTGVSGGGKTNTTRLAAALVDGVSVQANADANDFNLQLGSALLRKPDLIVMDEYLKRTRESAALAIYELSQYYSVTIKYQNPITVPIHCPIVLTGISLSPVFRRSAQFLRRVTRVNLNHVCHWPKARAENLLDRWSEDPARRMAADIICSDLAYRYVLNASDLLTSWTEAADLFAPVEDEDEDYVEVTDQLQSWLLDVNQYASRSDNRGRIRYFLNLQDENPAVRGWLELCDGPTSPGLYASARIQERDLRKCLGLPFELRLHTSRQRANVLAITLKRGYGAYVKIEDLDFKTGEPDAD